MNNGKLDLEWNELKDIWMNSAQTREVHIRMSDLLDELKSQTLPFEKDAIKRDLATVQTNWAEFKGMVSQFEKDAINKDLLMHTGILKKILNLFKKGKKS